MSEEKPPITRDDPLIFHFRVWDGENANSRGGATVVFEPSLSRFGVSICSRKDGFNKKLGRRIAMGRAKSKKSFCPWQPFVSKGPVTIDTVRDQATKLAQEEASVFGLSVR